MEVVVIAWMLKSGNYNVFVVVWVIVTFTTIMVPGNVPIFWIGSDIFLVPYGLLLIAIFSACYFQERML
jgi:hypothetical protein